MHPPAPNATLKITMPLVLKLLTIILTVFSFISSPPHVRAQVTGIVNPAQVTENTPTLTISFSSLVPNKSYELCLAQSFDGLCGISASDSNKQKYRWRFTADGSGNATTTPLCGDDWYAVKTDCSGNDDYFHTGQYKVHLTEVGTNTIIKTVEFNVAEFLPEVSLTPPNTTNPNQQLTISFNGLRWPNTNQSGRNQYEFKWDAYRVDGTKMSDPKIDGDNVISYITQTASYSLPVLAPGNYTLNVQRDDTDKTFKTFEIKVTNSGITVTGSSGFGQPGKNPCQGGNCLTAIGTLPTNISELTGRVLAIAIGLAGGIALIIMVVGAIKVLTSSGDQQKTAAGRDMIIAAVAGLLFLIFSALILRFIGSDLLGLFRTN